MLKIRCAIGMGLLLSPLAFGFEMGVDIHLGGASSTTNQQVADIMKARNLQAARMDFYPGLNLSNFRDQVQKIRANGGSVQVSLQNSYQWDNSCNQNLAFVEQDSYNQTAVLVNQIKDLVQDYEILNETQLRPEIMNEVTWNSAGTATSPYVGQPCVATLTSVLRGMARAIHDTGASSGLPLRVILGVVGHDFGFLTYMQQQGVAFDVVGFHVYPSYSDNSLLSDPWYGTGGPLAQLAAFNRPVHINEFDCGEIYDASYENQAGGALTESCLKSIAKHMLELKQQTVANLESVYFYELTDEPSKAAPENHFGLMSDLSTPKIQLYLASAFAGGALSSTEESQITSRGLLTSAQITSFKVAAAPSPSLSVTPAYTLGITGPASGADVSGTIQVMGMGTGFLNVELFNATGVFLGRATPSSTGAFSISVDTNALANGSQTLSIKAWDSTAGQPFRHTAQASVSVNVQNAVALSPSPRSHFGTSLICTRHSPPHQCGTPTPNLNGGFTAKIPEADPSGNASRRSGTIHLK